uniref:XisI protein n=1 Tax=Candidatus Kentrum sp. UNK TaxID=2126344 RepID=A0A451AL79_9GAMM|nr:MAG: XisI protein [Candidatus Kentron sp. UNK]VFK72256.1 MAG: XisI protein [Candidatus Kentron sp. UNK]
MDTIEDYRELIREIFDELTETPYAYGNIQFETVFDRDSDRYLLMIVGRDDDRYVHGCLVHVDIVDGKLWIQRDGTEQGFANILIEAGVDKARIVPGFRSPSIREHMGLAAA